eukprot:TRINITY_DN2021_c0_g1_i1.p1 TRINITY_DN2021_c0_g1~~TRINITY_DN2021_c0_g1_i1.p1  ORF type:complete len:111 (+),score=15.39 TRINITY_DN2021_c0_g1_i1:495-827(+)
MKSSNTDFTHDFLTKIGLFFLSSTGLEPLLHEFVTSEILYQLLIFFWSFPYLQGIVSGGKLMEISDQQIIRSMEVNALGNIWMVRAFLPAMLEANEGLVRIHSVHTYILP